MTMFDEDRFPLATDYTNEQRRAKTAAMPKCPCGNILGLETQAEGKSICRACQRAEECDPDTLITRIEELEEWKAEHIAAHERYGPPVGQLLVGQQVIANSEFGHIEAILADGDIRVYRTARKFSSIFARDNVRPCLDTDALIERIEDLEKKNWRRSS